MKKMQCDSRSPSYTPYPNFTKALPIGDTPRLVYAHLFGRAQLSRKNKWSDSAGVYIYYPIADLARDCGKCATTIKTALKILEEANLIELKRMGVARANKIYVKIPETPDCPSQGQESVHHRVRELSTNYEKEILDGNYTFAEGESL